MISYIIDFFGLFDIEISFTGIINLFFGIFIGFILFTIIYLYFLVRGQSVDFKKIKLPKNDVEIECVEQLVLQKQLAFKKKKKVNGDNYFSVMTKYSYELVDEIARQYYPKSKYPMYELSINESMELVRYIIDRIDELIDRPVIRNSKNLKIAQMVGIYNTKKSFDENRLVKKSKAISDKAHLGKVVKVGSMAINYANPAYWFRKFIVNTSIDYVTKKMCIIIIGIVGEETISLYSKKLFNKPVKLSIVENEIESIINNKFEKETK